MPGPLTCWKITLNDMCPWGWHLRPISCYCIPLDVVRRVLVGKTQKLWNVSWYRMRCQVRWDDYWQPSRCYHGIHLSCHVWWTSGWNGNKLMGLGATYPVVSTPIWFIELLVREWIGKRFNLAYWVVTIWRSFSLRSLYLFVMVTTWLIIHYVIDGEIKKNCLFNG